MKKKTENVLLYVLMALLLVSFFWGIDAFELKIANTMLHSFTIHVFAMAIFLLLIKEYLPSLFGRVRGKVLLWVFPCLLIALNNLPFLALLDGRAKVIYPQYLWLLALESLSVGAFEEIAFRGFLFPRFSGKFLESKKKIFLYVLISSAVFGLFHLLNLLEGAGIGETLLQVGYTTLVGGMCAFTLLKTKNLLIPILLHSVYDFAGSLLPRLAEGTWWDLPTVLWTAGLVVLTFFHLLVTFLKTPAEELRGFLSLEGNEK